MQQSVLKGFELLLMSPEDIMKNYHRAQTLDEINEMILKVCHAAQDEAITDIAFRGMILKLLEKKADLLEEMMPPVRLE